MIDTASSVLAPWSNFYIMMGSSAASLTGLMFVVITLVTRIENAQSAHNGMAAFSTPTVVHFATALLLSAILSAPWPSLGYPAALLGFAGVCGLVYILRVMGRTKKLTGYSPDLEDWAWFTMLPLVAYSVILAGAAMLLAIPAGALFALAAGIALLVFIGIRNSWDIVTYIAIRSDNGPPRPSSD